MPKLVFLHVLAFFLLQFFVFRSSFCVVFLVFVVLLIQVLLFSFRFLVIAVIVFPEFSFETLLSAIIIQDLISSLLFLFPFHSFSFSFRNQSLFYATLTSFLKSFVFLLPIFFIILHISSIIPLILFNAFPLPFLLTFIPSLAPST